jgi:Zn-dependent protease
VRLTFLSLGTPFGIPVRLHISVVYLILLAFLWNGLGALLGLSLLVLVVLFHELGHGVVAQMLGVKVLGITLHPGGGLAQMNIVPEQPKQELIIALAGPLTNLVLALPAVFLLLANGMPVFSPEQVSLTWALVSSWATFNLMLGSFNLLPAFPMDGGRILRAFLVKRKGYLQATELAVRVGRYLAIGLLVIAFAQLFQGEFFGFFAFGFIAVFIWLMGGRELMMVRLRHMSGGENPLGRMFQFGGQAGPGGQPGANPLADLFRAAQNGQGFGQQRAPGEAWDVPEAEYEERPGAPHRPQIQIDNTLEESEHGFSDEDIKRLEGQRGRLKRSDE